MRLQYATPVKLMYMLRPTTNTNSFEFIAVCMYTVLLHPPNCIRRCKRSMSKINLLSLDEYSNSRLFFKREGWKSFLLLCTYVGGCKQSFVPGNLLYGVDAVRKGSRGNSFSSKQVAYTVREERDGEMGKGNVQKYSPAQSLAPVVSYWESWPAGIL